MKTDLNSSEYKIVAKNGQIVFLKTSKQRNALRPIIKVFRNGLIDAYQAHAFVHAWRCAATNSA
jgi:hypothetical protein